MNKQLVSLICLLAIVAAAIYFLVLQSSMQTQEKNLLFPSLAENATKVERIKISMARGTFIEAVPSRIGWQTRIEDINTDYPVDQTRLAELIEGLSEAVLFEAKTSRPENYSKLNLTDLSNPDSLATLVEITTPSHTHEVLIGSQASSGQGSYVRLVGEKQSWMLDHNIQLPTDSSDWLKQPILDISAEQVSAITRLGTNGFTVQNSGVEDNLFELRDMQPQQSLKYATIVDSFVDSLLGLSFDKIVAATPDTWSAEADIVTYELLLNDSAAIQVSLLNADPTSLVKFERMTTSGQSYWDGLTYQISNFSAGQLDKVSTDFLKASAEVQPNAPIGASIDEGESPSGE